MPGRGHLVPQSKQFFREGITVPALLPAIDRHRWLADWEPMSLRSISAVLAYRQDAAQFPHDL